MLTWIRSRLARRRETPNVLGLCRSDHATYHGRPAGVPEDVWGDEMCDARYLLEPTGFVRCGLPRGHGGLHDANWPPAA